jgi:glycosyltransferase involved in cell wall biosynthesis
LAFDIHLVVVSKTFHADAAGAQTLRLGGVAVEVFPARVGPQLERAVPAIERHRCPAAYRRVHQLLTRRAVDLVHVEGFYLMQHVPDPLDVPVLLVEQNVEYELERQRALAEAADPGRSRLAREAELSCWTRATHLAAVTPEDQLTIEHDTHRQVALVPDGADHVGHLRVAGGRCSLERPQRPLIALVANFGYAPNVDAALHLHRDILPLVRAQVPDVQVWLVGNAPPPQLRALSGSDVTVTGRVDDVLPYLDAADVAVCPLRVGGGVKVKTIEALRRGKAIVSTPVGAQGLDGPARAALAIAEDDAKFASHVVSLLLDPGERGRRERRAATAARALPSWDDGAAALTAAYGELLEEHRAEPVAAGAAR